MYIELNQKELLLLSYGLNGYMEQLEERIKSTNYFFQHYHEETRKQISEENLSLLQAQMIHVDHLREKILAYLF